MKRDLLDLISARPAGLIRRLRAIALGTALAGTGFVSTSVATAATPRDANVTLTPTIVDRSRKATKLILKLPGKVGSYMMAHSSHRSHSSHSSHSSHYSGTSGVVRTPSVPAPAPRPTTTPASPAPALPLAAVNGDVLTGKFQTFNRLTRTLTIKDSIGTVYEFAWRDDTTIKEGQRMDDYLESHSAGAPWNTAQSLTVTWKPSVDGKKRVATAVR